MNTEHAEASQADAAATAQAQALAQFKTRISGQDLSPLWERTARLVPGSECVSAVWPYAQLRPLLADAAQLISKMQAERRVLVLENPALRGSSFITRALYAGLQIILPGEVAPVHRHTPCALRFVIEGEGAYTTVAGEQVAMAPGDFVVTPAWAWHEHGNLGPGPVVWLDGLDTPFAQLFGAHFRENAPASSVSNFSNASNASKSSNGISANDPTTGPSSSHSPSPALSHDAPPVQPLIYRFEATRAALHAMARSAAHFLCSAQGHKLRYKNPATGAEPFRTVAAFMQLLPAGFAGTRYRATDGAVFNVAQGQCTVHVGGRSHRLQARDSFVIPPWEPYAFEVNEAHGDCLLFSYSDRAAQEALGYWREEHL